MKVQDVINEVARRADTPNQQIGVDEVSRVIATLGDVLAEQPIDQVDQFVRNIVQAAVRRKDNPESR